MRKWLLAVVAAVLVLGGSWYWASPSLAMRNLRDAAISGDRDDLNSRVDFPVVRESLKSQFKTAMMTEMAKQKDANSGFAALGAALAMSLVDPFVDAMVSPEGMKKMVENGKFAKPGDTDQSSDTAPEWQIERKGLDRFTASPKTADGSKAPTLVFHRDGLGWKLVDVVVPAPSASDGG